MTRQSAGQTSGALWSLSLPKMTLFSEALTLSALHLDLLYEKPLGSQGLATFTSLSLLDSYFPSSGP